MAATYGTTDSPLKDHLFAEPYRFDFFQAVRLLEQIDPERAPVGQDSEPLNEAVRFRTRASLTFPPSQIFKLAGGRSENGGPPEMTVAFMGLTGPLGVLPQHFTELVAERARYGDTALWEFFDLFNHRAISLFYRIWEKHRLTVAFERGQLDHFTQYLFDTIGMGTEGLRQRLSVPDQALLLYGGLIAQRPHSVSIVEAILGDYFDVPVSVQQFAGHWLKLGEDDSTRLGARNNRLGVNTLTGPRFWETQSNLRPRFGPLTFTQFTAFLPVGSAFKPAKELARFLVGQEFDFDLQLTLKADEVPDCVITTHQGTRPMLGWTTWLKTQSFKKDDSQVVLKVTD
jgi:type VI secretion system protein ImpH